MTSDGECNLGSAGLLIWHWACHDRHVSTTSSRGRERKLPILVDVDAQFVMDPAQHWSAYNFGWCIRYLSLRNCGYTRCILTVDDDWYYIST